MLSWNEIILRAKKFSKEWQNANYEKGETQSFYNDFFQVFGRKRRDVGIYERAVEKLNNKHGFIDLFWPSVLLVEQKSEGRAKFHRKSLDSDQRQRRGALLLQQALRKNQTGEANGTFFVNTRSETLGRKFERKGRASQKS